MAFVVRRETGKDTEASETVRILEEKNFEDKLKKYSMGDVSLKGIYRKCREYFGSNILLGNFSKQKILLGENVMGSLVNIQMSAIVTTVI